MVWIKALSVGLLETDSEKLSMFLLGSGCDHELFSFPKSHFLSQHMHTCYPCTCSITYCTVFIREYFKSYYFQLVAHFTYLLPQKRCVSFLVINTILNVPSRTYCYKSKNPLKALGCKDLWLWCTEKIFLPVWAPITYTGKFETYRQKYSSKRPSPSRQKFFPLVRRNQQLNHLTGGFIFCTSCYLEL